ncbi:LytTr DNA-binding domain-containing protein [Anaerosporobacter mobilis DSM 15930]|uniref:LytTr DNA-binding domain-containing protein n=1 Tax=Anaerosporobacter mobilis DSM 15930 TaxID=1120996 RepID=A0A1M7KMW0_9FIRM|nr:LytTR family DNA-binding domain-containing protein [Anaerosporobacter mobilis]SHM66820.1 LytTr DNA-binding domain-containing protein [Anaerosporobacter mobilis DSM 15930]
MKINLFQKKELCEEYADIYYREMSEEIRNICSIFGEKKFELYGIDNEEKQLLSIQDIYYFESVEKRTFAYMKTKVYQIQYNLAELEDRLSEQGFIRINKSVVINIFKIKKIRSELNMRVQAQLLNKEEIIISRHYKTGFEKYLIKMRGVMHANN